MNVALLVQALVALASAAVGHLTAVAWTGPVESVLVPLGLDHGAAGKVAYAAIALAAGLIVMMWLSAMTVTGGDAAFEDDAD